MSSVEVELARRQWEEGRKRLDEASQDRTRQGRLLAALEVVTDELRRRIGQTFTLADLVGTYTHAEDWVREAIEEHAPYPGWPTDITTVQDAAFHLYARGASDYAP